MLFYAFAAFMSISNANTTRFDQLFCHFGCTHRRIHFKYYWLCNQLKWIRKNFQALKTGSEKQKKKLLRRKILKNFQNSLHQVCNYDFSEKFSL